MFDTKNRGKKKSKICLFLAGKAKIAKIKDSKAQKHRESGGVQTRSSFYTMITSLNR